MHNGMIASSSLYPIKYLKVFLDSYGSYLETNILLASMLSICNTFVFVKIAFFDFFVSKIYVLSTHSYRNEKKVKFFYNDLGVQEVISYFTVGLNE